MKKLIIRNFILILCVICFYSSNIFSQFSVVSITPSNGTANVDTATTLSITFSAAIDTSARFAYPGDFFISLFFTPDSLVHEPESITFSPDMHTVNLYNLHLHNFTDYRFCIFDAVSVLGDSLDTPYAFYFTTSPTITNTATVSGIAGANPFGAMIFLFDSNPFEEDESDWTEWTVAPPASGAYTVDYVPAGIYWPLVIKNMYLDEDGDIDIQNGSELAYYDSNNDYRPDSILVSPGAIISGIDMTLHDVFTQTARNPIPDLELIVHNWSADARLVEFETYDLLPDGYSMFWQFTYYSPLLLQSKSWLSVGDLVISIIDDSINTDTTALPLNWLDSDTIMSIAENSGGFQFRQLYPDVEIIGGCGYFETPIGKKSQIAVWFVEYNSEFTSANLFYLINAITGQIITGIDNKIDQNKPITFTLNQNYPNPFNPTTTIEFNLPTVAEVEIKIYNLAAQEVGFIKKGTMSAGNQKIIWNAENLPSGIYFYKIIAGEFSDIKKCILIK